MVRTWAPDDLWELVEPLLPVPARRRQGGGRRQADDRAVLAAVVYMVQAGCSWRVLPAVMFGLTRSTTHRRFTLWCEHGVWTRLHQHLLHQLGERAQILWTRSVVDSISVRALKGAPSLALIQWTAVNRGRRFTSCAIRTACR
jgi:transposase